jgi:hypothetical protein
MYGGVRRFFFCRPLGQWAVSEDKRQLGKRQEGRVEGPIKNVCLLFLDFPCYHTRVPRDIQKQKPDQKNRGKNKQKTKIGLIYKKNQKSLSPFCQKVFVVFFYPPHREALKNTTRQKKKGKVTCDIFCHFFVKTKNDFFVLLSNFPCPCRETRKNARKKKGPAGEKRCPGPASCEG